MKENSVTMPMQKMMSTIVLMIVTVMYELERPVEHAGQVDVQLIVRRLIVVMVI